MARTWKSTSSRSNWVELKRDNKPIDFEWANEMKHVSIEQLRHIFKSSIKIQYWIYRINYYRSPVCSYFYSGFFSLLTHVPSIRYVPVRKTHVLARYSVFSCWFFFLFSSIYISRYFNNSLTRNLGCGLLCHFFRVYFDIWTGYINEFINWR